MKKPTSSNKNLRVGIQYFRQHIADLLLRVKFEDIEIIVTRHGRPYAKLINYEDK